jgi:Protein of unknown function (DUF2508)
MQGTTSLDDLTYQLQIAATQSKHSEAETTIKDPYKVLKDIIKSRQELSIAYAQFDMVSDPLLVDHIVFRIGAAERRLSYLLRTAKETGLSFEGVQWEWNEERGPSSW